MMKRKALITGAGAAGGIGFACARALGAAGCDLAIASTTSRIHDRAAELRALGFEVSAHIGDLTDVDQVARVVAEVGTVDILVNNAGMGAISEPLQRGSFLENTPDLFARKFAVTFEPTRLMTHAVLPAMRAVFQVPRRPTPPAESSAAAATAALMLGGLLSVALGTGEARSADFQSAVSQVCNLRDAAPFERAPTVRAPSRLQTKRRNQTDFAALATTC